MSLSLQFTLLSAVLLLTIALVGSVALAIVYFEICSRFGRYSTAWFYLRIDS